METLERKEKASVVEILNYAKAVNGTLSVIDDYTIKCKAESGRTIFYLDESGNIIGCLVYDKNEN